LKHAEKSVIYRIIISEGVITSGEIRERIKETVSKTCERQEQTKKKTTKKKEERGVLNNKNPKQRFKWCAFVSPGGL
jgi:hypothetical protein